MTRRFEIVARPPQRWRALNVLLLVGLPLAALAATLLILPPALFAIVYGGALYPALSALFAFTTSWTSVPLGLAVVPVACGILLWRIIAPGVRLPLRRRLLGPLLLALLLLAAYLVTWGVNYRRPPLLELIDVPPRPVTQNELDAFAGELLGWVRSTSNELAPGEAGPAAVDPAAALAAISVQLERLSLEVGWPATLPHGVKLLPPGSLLSSGYAGMLFPFTLEPQVDAGLSPVSRVAVGAHELAHAAGFASETDADLAALLAGLRAPDPLARYATALTLLGRSLGSLSLDQRSFIIENLPPRALQDLSDSSLRSRRYLRPTLAARMSTIYNRILRGQGVEAGVASYGLAPELATLLALEGLLPAPPLPVPDGGVDQNDRSVLVLRVSSSAIADVQLLATRGR